VAGIAVLGRVRCSHAMLKLAVAVVAIALADCVNPSLIGGELFVATGEHPRRQTTAFAAAALIVTFVSGLALAIGLGDLILSLVPKPGRTVKYGLIAFAGVVLVCGGVVVWIRRKALVSTKESDDRGEPHRPAALMGAGIAGLELLTAFPYFAAIAMIAGSGVSDVGKLSLLVLYCVIYTLPLIAIAVVIAIMGERAERILRPVSDWLSAHWPVVVAPLTAAFGIGVLAFGIVQLSSM
jgi:cytochrome c biogenesis protein CcdA